MNLSLYEQETIINYNEEEATASIYTHNRALIRKLDKFAQERPGDCHRQKTSHEGKAVDFTVPKSWVKISPPRRLTEDQKERLRKASTSPRFTKQAGANHRPYATAHSAEDKCIPGHPLRRKTP